LIRGRPCLALSLLLLLVSPRLVTAQSNTDWAKSVVLFHLASTTQTRTVPLNKPSIVADPAGGLHVFWSVVVPTDLSAIYYTYWDGMTWSKPIDILVGPNMGRPNNNASVAMDRKGFFHLTWQNEGLFYSQAHASEAGSAQGWTSAVELAPPVSGNDIYVDMNDTVHIVYGDLYENGDIFYRRSDTFGTRWSEPTNVSALPAATESTGSPEIIVTSDGTVHVAWGQYQLPDGWPPTGAFYAKSIDAGKSWSEPLQLGGSSHGAPGLASLSDQEIHSVWLTTGTAGRFSSRTLDGGETWDAPRQFAPDIHMLILGSPQLVTDSAGQLHLTMSGLQGEDFIFSSQWDGQGWQPPERITDATGRGENAPALAVSHGNQLHVVWLDIHTNDVSYTWRTVNAPSVPPGAVPTLAPTPTAVLPATATLAPGPTMTPAQPVVEQTVPPLQQGSTAIPGLWLLPVIILVVGAVVGAQLMRRSR